MSVVCLLYNTFIFKQIFHCFMFHNVYCRGFKTFRAAMPKQPWCWYILFVLTLYPFTWLLQFQYYPTTSFNNRCKWLFRIFCPVLIGPIAMNKALWDLLLRSLQRYTILVHVHDCRYLGYSLNCVFLCLPVSRGFINVSSSFLSLQRFLQCP